MTYAECVPEVAAGRSWTDDVRMDAMILDLARELAEVSRLVEDDDVATTLGRFVERVVNTVPECDAALIAVQTAQTTEIASRFERFSGREGAEALRAVLDEQLSAAEGPLHDTLAYGEPRRIGDLASDGRWPKFSSAAADAGYRSCLFLPLPAATEAAAFGLFSGSAGAFDSTSYDVVLLFALHAGVAFDNVQLFNDSRTLVDQLRTALSTRVVIGQAAGVLMHRYSITSDVALDVLKRGSQDQNIKLRQLALELVEAQNAGNLAPALRKYGLSLG
ncbi:GAF and ANTAR domain-containing protein [Kribbella sp. NPDC026611]|uniref:GAF and ANTAR domain-containing protein n=1 Tax=Kribbella sp. NPDC026611 TaxID=3154911 RepID=UPI0033FF686B